MVRESRSYSCPPGQLQSQSITDSVHPELNMGDSFKDLVVCQRAMQHCVEIYQLTSTFPDPERFGLTSQLRRAAVSIASNIAEGYGRSSTGEYRLFLGHARGSNCELQTQLAIASALGFGSVSSFAPVENLSAEVSRLLIPMMDKLHK